jgi:hypothetical protein
VWEYRLVWPRKRPSWWGTAWDGALRSAAAEGRSVEERPDTYLVLPGRVDAGLKLRGGQENDFDLKVLHDRVGGWELWEKCAWFRWNHLEVLRLAAMLQVPAPAPVPAQDVTPGKGAEAFLEAAGLQPRRVTVRKKRIQGPVAALLPDVRSTCADPDWLAELVEMKLQDRRATVFSLCLEAMQPLRGGIAPVPGDGGLQCGYPEILDRHLGGRL